MISTISAEAKTRLQATADALLTARHDHPIDELPSDLRPGTIEEAYFVQDTMAKTLGKICGWKVGGPKATTPLFGPMPLTGLTRSGEILADPNQRLRGVEAEIAYLLGEDLPPRSTLYTREELVHAVASCHPAIEELEAAFPNPDAVDRFSMIADLQSNGGFVPGPAFHGWRDFDFADETVKLSINGREVVQAKASNPGGTDLIRLLLWLANEGAWRTGGLQKGQWVTTGNWTGKVRAEAGSSVTVAFEHAGNVSVRFR